MIHKTLQPDISDATKQVIMSKLTVTLKIYPEEAHQILGVGRTILKPGLANLIWVNKSVLLKVCRLLTQQVYNKNG